MPDGLAQDKWYLVQLDMENLEPVAMRECGVYHFWWYIRQYEDCTKHPTTECSFWPEIIKTNQVGTLGNILPVIPSKVHNLPQKIHTFMSYQDDISMAGHMLFGLFQFGTTVRNKLKSTNIIEKKQWKESENKDRIRESTIQIPKKWYHWGSNNTRFLFLGLHILHLNK